MEISEEKLLFLQKKSRWVWEETLLLHQRVAEVRIASCLSAVDLLTCLFYGENLNLFPENPLDPKRDRIIPSKGHGALALYPILADLGYFPKKELSIIGSTAAKLSAIPAAGFGIFETINGSLGHGLGVATGIAIALNLQNNPAKTIVLHGDGELSEGAVWEAIMFAAQHQLKNIYLIIDGNAKSMLGKCDDIMSWKNFEKRFNAFGWQTFRCNGHDFKELNNCYNEFFSSESTKPKVLFADTIKGYGVPELENSDICHVLNLSEKRISELLQRGDEKVCS